jgi:MFS family permease
VDASLTLQHRQEYMAASSIARRNLVALTSAQAFGAAGPPIVISLGGLVGQMLAPHKLLVTLPVSLYTVGLALATIPVSRSIQRAGRRSTYLFGCCLAIVAGLVAAYGIWIGSFLLFCIGTVIAGVNGACVQTYRFAAVDAVEPQRRAQAISLVMMGGLVAAVIGPQAVIWTRDLLSGVAFAGSFLAQASLALLALIVLSFLRAPPVMPLSAAGGRPLRDIVKTPAFITAAGAGMVSYGTMGFLMTAAPIAMVGCGHTIGEAALGIQWHVLAMFGPSLFTGQLIKRFGETRVTIAGLVLTVCSAIVALADLSLGNFWGCLVLLGFGWNLGFLGATSMVAGCCQPNERAKVQGFNDFLVFGTAALASLSAGGFMQMMGGWSTIAWITIAIAAVMIVRSSYVVYLSGRTALART